MDRREPEEFDLHGVHLGNSREKNTYPFVSFFCGILLMILMFLSPENMFLRGSCSFFGGLSTSAVGQIWAN